MIKLIAAGVVLGLSSCAHRAGEPLRNSSNPDVPQLRSEETWDGSIHQWGTMREVLKEGQTEARIGLRESAEPAGAVGVGALAGLQGEITILDGRVWLAADANGSKAAPPSSVNGSATLLTVAYVPRWTRIPIAKEDVQRNLDEFVRNAAKKAGIDVHRPFPFIIDGRMSVEAHVIRGECPHGTAVAVGSATPDRFSRLDTSATLVGFFAEGAEGILTHHGSTTHVHVVIQGEPSLSGHVDSVSISAGATLRLPAPD